jgi:hypothetical protein
VIGRLLWWLFGWWYRPGVSASVLDALDELLASGELLFFRAEPGEEER